MFDYSPIVWEHFSVPRNAGTLPNNTVSEHSHGHDPCILRYAHGRAGSIDEKSLLHLDIAVNDERIIEARFQAYGCGVTIACGSWLCEQLGGKTLPQAVTLDSAAIAAGLALPALKIRCAVIAEQALSAAVKDYQQIRS